MRTLELPQLRRLLARLEPLPTEPGDPQSLTPPHERVLAAAAGLAAPDGCVPWAAAQVQQAGRAAGSEAWAWITPCHWHVATDHIVMRHPRELALEPRAAQALLAAMRPFFAQDGITLEYDAPTRWLARGELFRGLATAALDRVMGRDIDEWVPRAPAAAPLRRLQQEMQMLLYTHAANDERMARGLQPVNSFWASGTGALPAVDPSPAPDIHVAGALRDPALLQDWPAWSAAWEQIDANECHQLNDAMDRGQPVTLTLCGEANARRWSGAKTGLWARFRSGIARESTFHALEVL